MQDKELWCIIITEELKDGTTDTSYLKSVQQTHGGRETTKSIFEAARYDSSSCALYVAETIKKHYNESDPEHQIDAEAVKVMVSVLIECKAVVREEHVYGSSKYIALTK